jgi:two-component system sensor histidine kinase HydH
MIFEVYRRFVPTGPSRHMPLGRMRGAGRLHLSVDREEPPPQMIYVGLEMTEVKAAAAADVRHAVLMGAILLLVGFAGVVLLFIVQGYRASRLSLSRERAFSDTLVENMPTGLIALDAERNIATVNPAARATLHLAAEGLAGAAASDKIPRELIDELDGLEPSGVRLEKEIDCPLFDGRRIPIALSCGVLKDEQGVTRGYVLLFKDLSEVHRLRREIARNQRLAAVGRLAAGVAHEIRNPLSSIKGFATYFKERAQTESEAQQIADVMIQEVDRLNRVITQLLEFARPVSLSPKTVSAHSLIASSIRLVDREAERRGIRIETRLSPQVTSIRVDPDRVRQVLLNLYLNALEAMESGGRLIVCLEPGDKAQWYRIRVSDTGSGIEEEHLANVFEPYFTTKPSGTGLGLAIVHNIVEALDGRVSISSGPEGGTTVVLNLPGLASASPEAV